MTNMASQHRYKLITKEGDKCEVRKTYNKDKVPKCSKEKDSISCDMKNFLLIQSGQDSKNYWTCRRCYRYDEKDTRIKEVNVSSVKYVTEPCSCAHRNENGHFRFAEENKGHIEKIYYTITDHFGCAPITVCSSCYGNYHYRFNPYVALRIKVKTPDNEVFKTN